MLASLFEKKIYTFLMKCNYQTILIVVFIATLFLVGKLSLLKEPLPMIKTLLLLFLLALLFWLS